MTDLTLHPNYVCKAHTDTWRNERAKVVTGSQVGALMGLSHWRDREDVVADFEFGTNFKTNRYMLWGSRMELPNMKLFGELSGVKFTHTNTFFVNGPLGATLDGVVFKPEGKLASPEIGKEWVAAPSYWSKSMAAIKEVRKDHPGPWVLEMKQTSEKYKKDWGKHCPDSYWAQVQCQLYVTGFTAGIIVARIGASDMRFHVIKEDKFFQQEMAAEAQTLLDEVGDK